MPRSRAALRPLLPPVADEEDGTWLLTFSDLVLLLLSFVAIGILMERAGGAPTPLESVTLHPARPATDAAATVVADAPARRTHPLPAAPALPQGGAAPALAARRDDDPRLRTLAARLESRLAAEGLAGLSPVVVEDAAVVVRIAEAAGAAAPALAPPRVVPELVPALARAARLVDTTLGSDAERALARVAHVAHEVARDDPTLVVAASSDTRPPRVTVARAGG